jgi:hypothetical protein
MEIDLHADRPDDLNEVQLFRKHDAGSPWIEQSRLARLGYYELQLTGQYPDHAPNTFLRPVIPAERLRQGMFIEDRS